MYCSPSKPPFWVSQPSEKISVAEGQSAPEAVAYGQLYDGLPPACMLPWGLLPCGSRLHISVFPDQCCGGKHALLPFWSLHPCSFIREDLNLGRWDAASRQLCLLKVYPPQFLLCKRAPREVLIWLCCSISGQCCAIDIWVTALTLFQCQMLTLFLRLYWILTAF